uniref:hypothetical protein n=1 Tax=Acetatifactor sp. TaxID=1872090 RepID=UPI004057C8BE
MGIMKWIVKKVVVGFFEWYIKTFRYAGILSLVFVIECVCLWFYCTQEIEFVEIRAEQIQITNVEFEEELNKNGEEGYRFYLTLRNDGSKRAIASGLFLRNDEGYSIRSEEPGVYQNAYSWGSVYSGVVVPPGTEVTTDFFVEKLVLEYEETEDLVFQAGLDGAKMSMPISELGLE